MRALLRAAGREEIQGTMLNEYDSSLSALRVWEIPM